MPFLKTYEKFVAGLVVVCFSFSLITVPPAPQAIAQETQIPGLPADIRLGGIDLSRAAVPLGIPQELASIKEVFLPDTKNNQSLPLIHIQSVHSHPETQKKIYALLKFLDEKYGIESMFIEGAGEQLNPAYFNFFDDKKLNVRVAEKLVDKGELTGAELFLIESQKKIPAYGLEDPRLYRENLTSFQNVMFKRPLTSDFAKNVRRVLDQLETLLLQPQARRLLRSSESFDAGQMQLLSYALEMERKAKEMLGIDLRYFENQLDWPQMIRLLRLYEVESELEPERIQADRDKLISFLKEIQVKPELIQGFEHLSFSPFQTGMVYDPGFRKNDLPRYLAEGLVAETSSKGFSFEQYPYFTRFLEAAILQSELEAERLFAEMEKLFESLTRKVSQREEEWKLVDTVHRERLIERLFDLELTPKDYTKLTLLNQGERPLVRFLLEIQMLAEKARREVKNLVPSRVEDIESVYEDAVQFYELAKDREETMVNRILEWMPSSDSSLPRRGNDEVSILITGGFHTDGLSKTFRKKQIAYTIVSPHITEKVSPEVYVSTLLGEKKTAFDVAYLEPALTAISRAMKESMTPPDSDFISQEIKSVLEAIIVVAREGKISAGRTILDVNKSDYAKDRRFALRLSKSGKSAVIWDSKAGKLLRSQNGKYIVIPMDTVRVEFETLAARSIPLTPDELMREYNILPTKTQQRLPTKPRRAEVRAKTNLEFVRAFEKLDITHPETIAGIRILATILPTLISKRKGLPDEISLRRSDPQYPSSYKVNVSQLINSLQSIERDQDLYSTFKQIFAFKDEESGLLRNPKLVDFIQGAATSGEAFIHPFAWVNDQLVLNPERRLRFKDILDKALTDIQNPETKIRILARSDIDYLAKMGFSDELLRRFDGLRAAHANSSAYILRSIEAAAESVQEIHRSAGRAEVRARIPIQLKQHKARIKGKNISQAAEIMGISQPGLSHHLQKHPGDFETYGIEKGPRAEVRATGKIHGAVEVKEDSHSFTYRVTEKTNLASLVATLLALKGGHMLGVSDVKVNGKSRWTEIGPENVSIKPNDEVSIRFISPRAEVRTEEETVYQKEIDGLIQKLSVKRTREEAAAALVVRYEDGGEKERGVIFVAVEKAHKNGDKGVLETAGWVLEKIRNIEESRRAEVRGKNQEELLGWIFAPLAETDRQRLAKLHGEYVDYLVASGRFENGFWPGYDSGAHLVALHHKGIDKVIKGFLSLSLDREELIKNIREGIEIGRGIFAPYVFIPHEEIENKIPLPHEWDIDTSVGWVIQKVAYPLMDHINFLTTKWEAVRTKEGKREIEETIRLLIREWARLQYRSWARGMILKDFTLENAGLTPEGEVLQIDHEFDIDREKFFLGEGTSLSEIVNDTNRNVLGKIFGDEELTNRIYEKDEEVKREYFDILWPEKGAPIAATQQAPIFGSENDRREFVKKFIRSVVRKENEIEDEVALKRLQDFVKEHLNEAIRVTYFEPVSIEEDDRDRLGIESWEEKKIDLNVGESLENKLQKIRPVHDMVVWLNRRKEVIKANWLHLLGRPLRFRIHVIESLQGPLEIRIEPALDDNLLLRLGSIAELARNYSWAFTERGLVAPTEVTLRKWLDQGAYEKIRESLFLIDRGMARETANLDAPSPEGSKLFSDLGIVKRDIAPLHDSSTQARVRSFQNEDLKMFLGAANFILVKRGESEKRLKGINELRRLVQESGRDEFKDNENKLIDLILTSYFSEKNVMPRFKTQLRARALAKESSDLESMRQLIDQLDQLAAAFHDLQASRLDRHFEEIKQLAGQIANAYDNNSLAIDLRMEGLKLIDDIFRFQVPPLPIQDVKGLKVGDVLFRATVVGKYSGGPIAAFVVKVGSNHVVLLDSEGNLVSSPLDSLKNIYPSVLTPRSELRSAGRPSTPQYSPPIAASAEAREISEFEWHQLENIHRTFDRLQNHFRSPNEPLYKEFLEYERRLNPKFFRKDNLPKITGELEIISAWLGYRLKDTQGFSRARFGIKETSTKPEFYHDLENLVDQLSWLGQSLKGGQVTFTNKEIFRATKKVNPKYVPLLLILERSFPQGLSGKKGLELGLTGDAMNLFDHLKSRGAKMHGVGYTAPSGENLSQQGMYHYLLNSKERFDFVESAWTLSVTSTGASLLPPNTLQQLKLVYALIHDHLVGGGILAVTVSSGEDRPSEEFITSIGFEQINVQEPFRHSGQTTLWFRKVERGQSDEVKRLFTQIEKDRASSAKLRSELRKDPRSSVSGLLLGEKVLPELKAEKRIRTSTDIITGGALPATLMTTAAQAFTPAPPLPLLAQIYSQRPYQAEPEIAAKAALEVALDVFSHNGRPNPIMDVLFAEEKNLPAGRVVLEALIEAVEKGLGTDIKIDQRMKEIFSQGSTTGMLMQKSADTPGAHAIVFGHIPNRRELRAVLLPAILNRNLFIEILFTPEAGVGDNQAKDLIREARKLIPDTETRVTVLPSFATWPHFEEVLADTANRFYKRMSGKVASSSVQSFAKEHVVFSVPEKLWKEFPGLENSISREIQSILYAFGPEDGNSYVPYLGAEALLASKLAQRLLSRDQKRPLTDIGPNRYRVEGQSLADLIASIQLAMAAFDQILAAA